MFFLPWWTYVLIGTVAFTCSFVAVWLAGVAFEKSVSDDGPLPCMTHLGTAANGSEWWCMLLEGHGDDHAGMWTDSALSFNYVPVTSPAPGLVDALRQSDAAGNVVIDESPGYLPGSAPFQHND